MMVCAGTEHPGRQYYAKRAGAAASRLRLHCRSRLRAGAETYPWTDPSKKLPMSVHAIHRSPRLLTASTRGRYLPALLGGGAAALSALVLAACSTASVPPAQVDREAVARYRDAGYPMPAAAAIETHRISGPVSGAPWSISLTRPADHANRALIVFLPSLGEADNAPNHWIELWSHAGYAVMSIQPLPDDAQVWATQEARSGDFERVARARFAANLMADRLARLSALLTEIRQRSLRGEPGLEGLDWAHLGLAGADLGAFAVQTIAARQPPDLASTSLPLTPLAYVAISPYAVRGAPAVGPEAVAHAPVLMISARDDIDAYGVITDTTLRRLAFDRLGNGDDYYLELGSATHRWLCGLVEPPAGEATTHRTTAFENDRAGKRGLKGGQADTMAPVGDEDDQTQDKRARNAASRAEAEKARGRAMTHVALSEVSFTAISLAFLDAYVREEPRARSWLTNSAAKWLQDGDRLKHR
jgi:hypothetical protein